MPLEDASNFPLIDITPTPPEPYEVRAIVWKTKDIPAGDVMTSMSGKGSVGIYPSEWRFCRPWMTLSPKYGLPITDMLIQAALQDSGEREMSRKTDTHWRCSNGRGSFNYRMK